MKEVFCKRFKKIQMWTILTRSQMEWRYYSAKRTSTSLRIMTIVKLRSVWSKKEPEKRLEAALGGTIFSKNFNFVCMPDFNILDAVSALKLSWIKTRYHVISDGFLTDPNTYALKTAFTWWLDMATWMKWTAAGHLIDWIIWRAQKRYTQLEKVCAVNIKLARFETKDFILNSFIIILSKWR